MASFQEFSNTYGCIMPHSQESKAIVQGDVLSWASADYFYFSLSVTGDDAAAFIIQEALLLNNEACLSLPRQEINYHTLLENRIISQVKE